MTKTERLKAAYNELKSGKIVEFIPDEGYRYTTYGCRCYLLNSHNPNCKRKYIGWTYFGSCANEMSLKGLRWIAKTIGGCTSYEYRIVDSIYE